MKLFRRAFVYFQPEWPRMLFGFVLLVFSVGANVLKPWPLAWIVDGMLSGKPLPRFLTRPKETLGAWGLLAALGLAIFILHAAHAAFAAAQNYLAIQVGLRGLARVRQELFAWLERLSLRFHRASRSGDLIYRASWDSYAFQTFFQQGLWTGLSAAVSLAFMIAIMVRMNWQLTLVALGAIPILLAVMGVFGRKMRQRSARAHQADSFVTSVIQQTIEALPLIQSYTLETAQQKRFDQSARTALATRLAQHGAEISYALSIAVVFGLGAAALAWFGGRETLRGRLTVGELLVFLAYLGQLFEPLNQLSLLSSTVADAHAGIHRVFEIFDAPIEVAELANARPLLDARLKTPDAAAQPDNPAWCAGRLELERVSFAYEPARMILEDVSVALAGGDSLAILGPSGAGKTTLLQLIPRFYDPLRGAVKFEGIDARELRLRDVRARSAFVLQEPLLLSGTAAENIAVGNPRAAFDEIKAAAQAAHAEEFILRLPKAYETQLGEGGAQLSVGEKQRLNLARAFLKNAPILLLDEPTSALDLESEALVMESLRELMRGRTTIIVAHKLATIRAVRRVLVLDQGRVAELGTQEELLARRGYYARLRNLSAA